MNALYISYDGLTDPLGQSQVIPYIQGLTDKGIHFNIISFEKELTFKKHQSTIKKILGSKIKWTPLEYTKNPPVISTIYDIFKLKKQVTRIIKENGKPDVIHCRSYISSLIGLWAKKKFNIPFIFDMRGFWADERVDGKIWDLNNFIYKGIYSFFKRKEKEFITESAHVVSLTKCGKEEIESWLLPNTLSISVIPCCTDENLFNSQNVKEVRSTLGIKEDEFVLTYLGSIGTWYMLDEMLDFFNCLQKEVPKSKFLFITKDDKNSILTKVNDYKINVNDIIIQPSEREMIPSYIAASDYSIFFIKPLYSKKASSPTKMGEVLNLGIPIICNSGVGDVDEIMKEVDANLIVEQFKKEDYHRVISYVKNNPAINAKEIIDISLNHFSLTKGIESYYQVYQNIFSKN